MCVGEESTQSAGAQEMTGDSGDTLSLLVHPKGRMAKHWRADGTLDAYSDVKYFALQEFRVTGIVELSAKLRELESRPRTCLIRGRWAGANDASLRDPEFRDGVVRRSKSQFDPQDLHAVMFDVDGFEPLGGDPVTQPELATQEYIETCLPCVFHGASYHWQLSSSAGHVGSKGLKAHLWFWLRRPASDAQLKAWARHTGVNVDVSLFDAVQIHYTAGPTFDPGVTDPVPVRSGFVDGLAGDDVPLDVTALTPENACITSSTQQLRASASRHEVLLAATANDPVAQKLRAEGLVLSVATSGALNITCPFADQHTGASGSTATQYFPPATGGYAKGNFRCMHAHCRDRARGVWLAKLGIVPDLDESAFAVVEYAATGGIDASGGASIPPAKHRTTDQANAERMVKHFGDRVMVVGDVWYTWVGTHWTPDERAVYRNTCLLSEVVLSEANAAQAEADSLGAGDRKTQLEATAKALKAWSFKCEMKSTVEAAIGLARKMLTIDASRLDTRPRLLNCRNGTVDLETGSLRPHDPAELITKFVNVDYVPEARCDRWLKALSEITQENGRGPTKPMVDFLQRWFGYCATGETRESKFVVHYGGGANGKSIVIDTISGVLGDYATAAAPGLVMGGSGKSDKHPTEIADLKGRRMVTAHESAQGGVLREDFVKHATGGDKLKARFMRGDFFEFEPTHKLQLLTNHKPRIVGGDHGIWRRILLVEYAARFGTAAAVACGNATAVQDEKLREKLTGEVEGILAWVVQGAKLWADKGLDPPPNVTAASEDYKAEQDRVGQFVSEVCEVGESYKESVTDGMGGGLYPAYQQWAKESGINPMGAGKFLTELERVVPGLHTQDEKVGGRTVKTVSGVRLGGLG
jgi:putative DNA primase/helicase